MTSNDTPASTPGPTVVLSQTAPWNRYLTNGYRTRYTQVRGRYFKVSAQHLNDVWTVEEINADGTDKGTVATDPGTGEKRWAGYLEHAFTLAEARALIAAQVAADTNECECAAAYLGNSWHLEGCPLFKEGQA